MSNLAGMIEDLQTIATQEGLPLRMTKDGESHHGWAVRFTSRHHHQPICTGWSNSSLEEACADLLGKSERSIAPYRKKIADATKREQGQCAREMRRMGVR